MSKRHFPARGDKVNDVSRIPNANGFVQRVLYDDGPDQVVVKFDNGVFFYDYESFRYCWTDNFGGCFIIQSGENYG